MRHEAALHRQIDTAVRMLGKAVPEMFEARLRREQLAFAQVTERDCQKDEEWDWVIANNTREQLGKLSARPAPLDEDPARLDNVPSGNCQNELSQASSPLRFGEGGRGTRPGGVLSPSPCEGEGRGEISSDREGLLLAPAPAEKCQNELPRMPESEWEAWEDLINGGDLTREERRQQMLRQDLPPWQKEADGRIAIREILRIE